MVRSGKKTISRILGHVVMLIISVCVILPVILPVISSFTGEAELIKNGYSFVPKRLSLDAYRFIFSAGNILPQAFMVSVILTAGGTALGLTITTLLGYALSRTFMPGRRFLMLLVIFALLFNGGLVPTYMTYTTIFKVKDTIWGMLLPGLLMNSFYVLLMKSFFMRGIPDDLSDASYIDGAGEWAVFFRIALPLVRPAVVCVGLFIAIGYWNDWKNYFFYMRTQNFLPLQYLLYNTIRNGQFLTAYTNQESAASVPSISVQMALTSICMLPTVILYPFISRILVRGISLTAVKE